MNKKDNIGRLVQEVCKPAVPRPEFKERLLKRLQTVVSTSKRDEVVKLRETGLTYAEIGLRFGLSKERIRQIVKGISSPKKPTPEIDVMLRVGQVAQRFGLHPNTVRRWNAKGILKSYRISPRGDRRFRRQDLDSFLKEE